MWGVGAPEAAIMLFVLTPYNISQHNVDNYSSCFGYNNDMTLLHNKLADSPMRDRYIVTM